jgi:thiamine-monophosphate kinase
MRDNEFALIAKHFAPLATDPGARGLVDDVCVIAAPGALVITADAVVEGVHFLPHDPIGAIAQKALRVNLSDLAAKGAQALGYVMCVQWPDQRDSEELALFAAGLARDQAEFGVSLWGGDTTRTPGPLTISITAFGRPMGQRTPARAGAAPLQDVWVTGTIGDGVLGLAVLQERAGAPTGAHGAAVIERYRRPQPRLQAAGLIAEVAAASLDVSDGLLGDCAKLAAASGVAITLDPAAIPYSPAARDWLKGDVTGEPARQLAQGGDDYEILFTAAKHHAQTIKDWSAAHGLAITCIGQTAHGAGVRAGAWEIKGYVHHIGQGGRARKDGEV